MKCWPWKHNYKDTPDHYVWFKGILVGKSVIKCCVKCGKIKQKIYTI